ncbi:MAG TPA: hypothetical protein PLK75_00125 [Bacteroidales bacterium]|nr:hypothetical protein [Bacteroidales bacterium]
MLRVIHTIVGFFVVVVSFAQVPLNLTTNGELQGTGDAYITTPGESVLIPNTHVKIIPPEHFMYSAELQGFVHGATSSTMQISEIIGTSYIMVSKSLTPEYVESQNFRYIEKRDITTNDGHDGCVFILGFTNKGVDYERMMFLAGDYNNTIWINVSYPAVSRNLLFDIFNNSLLTAQFIK